MGVLTVSYLLPAPMSEREQALFADYAARSRKRGALNLEAAALRTRSLAYRDIAAFLASDGTAQYEDLRRSADLRAGLDPSWAASLGRIVGLQDMCDDDASLAIDLLSRAVPQLGRTSPQTYAKLLVELLFRAELFDTCRELLGTSTKLATAEPHLETDLLNPWTGSPYADVDAWSESFNRRFVARGLAPLAFDASSGVPLDGVTSAAPSPVDGPLVSVVMTTYQPSEPALRSAIRSILAQSWQNLELIVVDDCSPEDPEALVLRAASGDRRVRYQRLPVNGGTYLARNAGIGLAAGEYITGQDDDDWSHPERIARQIAVLRSDDRLAGTMSNAVTVLENLVVQRPGYAAQQANTSSLMFRRHDAVELGGFLPVRKGADSEFRARLEIYTNRRVATLDDPLALVRITQDSLSRSDFRAGWHHPGRHAFRHAWRYWHRTASREALTRTQPLPFPVPGSFRVERPAEASRYDVVFAGEWMSYGGPQKSMLEEIHALTPLGLRIGVLHLDAARFMRRSDTPLCDGIQALINGGVVERVIDDMPATSRLVLLRYPPILQFPPAPPAGLVAERLVIVANQAPSERDGTDIRYDVRTCADNAEAMFHRRALWAPQGPTVRDAIADQVPEGELAEFDIPGIIDAQEWATERVTFRGPRPVIGRHSRDNVMKWPEERAALTAAYPIDGAVDVRLMGGAAAAQSVLETDPPTTWVVFATDEMDVRAFLNSLDFFVYFQHSQAYDAFGRAVLEALAAGCVAVLPTHYKRLFGDAALYTDESGVLPLVRRLYADPDRYRRQSELAMRRTREIFSHESYRALVGQLLPAGTEAVGDEPAVTLA